MIPYGDFTGFNNFESEKPLLTGGDAAATAAASFFKRSFHYSRMLPESALLSREREFRLLPGRAEVNGKRRVLRTVGYEGNRQLLALLAACSAEAVDLIFFKFHQY